MTQASPLARHRVLRTSGAVLLCCVASVVTAHVGEGDISGGLGAGFLHPILGPDHLVAMIAVGLWSAQLGPPAMWVLPVTFPLVMAAGGVLGIAGVPLPAVEIGIALSVLVLGAMIALALRPPLAWAGLLVAIFAIYHGYAHGAELPGAANSVAYAFGFVVATGLLHAIGIGIGEVKRLAGGTRILRGLGVIVVLLGACFTWGQLGET